MLQIMDRGVLTDSSGVSVDFKQVIIFMTSNVGSKALTTRRIGLQKTFKSKGHNIICYQEIFLQNFLIGLILWWVLIVCMRKVWRK